jgi:hypothetical protein
MAPDQRHGDAGERVSLEQDPPPPWWAKRRIRLPSLLACLVLAVFGLLGHDEHLLSAAGTAHATASAAVCVPATPPLMSVPWSGIQDLRRELLTVMAQQARSRYAWGAVSTADAWLDDVPSRLASSVLPDGLLPAGFEMRSWAVNPRLATRGDDVVADVFMFAGSEQALRFFTLASSVHCHRDGVAQGSSGTPQVRDLTWINPDAVPQEDAFLLRGRYVFRVGIVRPRNSLTATAAGVSAANQLACALPHAGCRAAGADDSQRLGADKALGHALLGRGAERAPARLTRDL